MGSNRISSPDRAGQRQETEIFMPQSLSKIILHLVFSTKNRARLILPEFSADLHAYIAGICTTVKSHAYKIGGTENHVHIACSLPRTITVGDLLEAIKTGSSKWMKSKSTRSSSFAWQAGYGAFSCGQSQLPVLINYIENQNEHHRDKKFEEELIELLKLYEVEYDERYLWD
jgi:putative transposase